jgi:hypothetical protein
MKIKHDNGMVTFLMRTGKDLVRSKMSITSAMFIVNKGTNVVEGNGQIIVDNNYFFPMETTPAPKNKKSGRNVK